MSPSTSSAEASPVSPRATNEGKQAAKADRRRNHDASTLGKKTSTEANRRAAVILEVLAGERLPSEAAALLGVSVTHYYILERKALEGLLAACERKPKGPPAPTAEQRATRLARELEQCRRECQRQAALVRTMQRTLGLPAGISAPAAAKDLRGKNTSKANAKKRRARRPAVRALRAAAALEKNSSSPNRKEELQQLSADASTGSPAFTQEGP
jgi:hypothetical protein